jgi:hypothetical protein
MSRTPLPFAAADVAVLARSLERQIAEHADGRPGHLDMLNMLARAGGFANFQHFRTQAETIDRIGTPIAPAPVDTARLARIAAYFDGDGRLIRWPGKASHRPDCLWTLWARLPARLVMHEREVNARLDDEHRFGDHALLRRGLVDAGLVRRNLEGTEYRRIEAPPPPEAKALIRLLAPRLRNR